MGYTTCIISALLLAGCSTVLAENWDPERTDADVTRENRWRPVTPDISPHELSQATRHNKRLVGRTLRTYSENAFTSIGFRKKDINLMGAAIGLAVHDTRFHIDDRKMLAMELRDVTNGERALFFGISVDW